MYTVLAVSIGNTRIQLGRIENGEVKESMFFEQAASSKVIDTLAAWWNESGSDSNRSVMLASVHAERASELRSLIIDQFGAEVYELENDIPVPIGRDLEPETIVGVDRLLDAAAAWEQLKQACVIIDAGSAITVDFVDGEGVFHGGAIMPGIRMQIRAMAEGANLLDEIDFRRPEGDAFGRSTSEAMLRGVYHGIRGGVWRVIESYAEAYGAYPLVIATGGDADTLFKNDEEISRIIPDLAIRGIAVAAQHATALDDEDHS